jgi:hypothetical protein
LAHALEQAGAEGAARVRIVHVLSADNGAYQQSLVQPQHRGLGSTVSEVWQKLLRRSDRFLSVDSALFLDPEITSYDYVHRYGAPLIHDLPELLAAYDVEGVHDVEDVVDFEGDVTVRDEGVEFQLGRRGTLLEYPFTLTELNDLVDELEAEVG